VPLNLSSPNRLLILIVTCNGAATIGSLLQSLYSDEASCRRPILIIDNASTDSTLDVIVDLSLPDVAVMPLPENYGVAKAYNLGIEHAAGMGVEWIFMLDQDSLCSPSDLDDLLTTAEQLVQEGRQVGAVCPTARSIQFPDVIHHPYRWNGFRLEPVSDGESDGPPVAVASAITSGTLYRVKALQAVGGFREDYFIDFVDHECHIRLLNAGWAFWWLKKATLYHHLGTIQRITADGLWIEHAPFRYYYMARNMTEGYLRLGGWKGLWYFRGELYRHLKALQRHGSAPRQCFRFVVQGLRDALLGRFGALKS